MFDLVFSFYSARVFSSELGRHGVCVAALNWALHDIFSMAFLTGLEMIFGSVACARGSWSLPLGLIRVNARELRHSLHLFLVLVTRHQAFIRAELIFILLTPCDLSKMC